MSEMKKIPVFGVQSIDELPVISEDLVEQFKDEVEMEVEADERQAQEQAADESEQITLDI